MTFESLANRSETPTHIVRMKKRCTWPGTDPRMIQYHDREWGVPVRNDRKIFEFLVLEGAQAGLSWKTILNKRAGYRKAFANFNPTRVARLTTQDLPRLLKNPAIVRNRLKIEATINNAKRFIEIQEAFGSFSAYMWSFVEGRPIDGKRNTLQDVPATTHEAEKFSKDLKARGFKFLGPTVVYAHMQATGMANDHTTDCFRYRELQRAR